MTSTTSGTTAFSLDVDDIIEAALEPLGGDYTNAGEQSKARRSLNLILIELQNKNIPLNKLNTVSVPLVAGTSTYTLAPSISDILEVTIKNDVDNTESTLNRWGLKEYHDINQKTTESRPTLFTTDRKASGVIMRVWPVPDASIAWTAQLLVADKIEDINASFQKIDLPYRYFPLIVAWLSFKLSLNRQGIDPALASALKMEYKEIMMDTFDEDRERVDFSVVPGGVSGR